MTLIKVVDATLTFQQERYKKAWDAAHFTKAADKTKPAAVKSGRGAIRPKAVPASATFYTADRNMWTTLVALLRKLTLLPTVIFTFSKKRCEDYGGRDEVEDDCYREFLTDTACLHLF